ncbi:cobalamin-binding protein [Methyloversatilis thermotolerans]|uniref:cobalamin-binding protein n=1 Tax=Methyloversatilis thermotolerans TaxID=1346290 RepID=UPI0003AAA335|nr:cobalamin-binding protein [Methyloversatilis thermotolerans]
MRTLCVLLCAVLALPAAAAELKVTDDAGHAVVLPAPARRIVSLAPHVTELLFAAGAGAQVVGATQYSDWPEAAKAVPRVGGYTSVDMEAVVALKPDLVIAWKSGNRNQQYDRLQKLGIPVYVNEPRSLEDVARSLEQFGRLAGTPREAEAAARAFRARRDALAAQYAQRPALTVFYQIWNKPLMTINGQHLISDVMALCGGRNVFAGLPMLAPTVTEEAVLAAAPEVIVASGMGESRPEWLDAWRRWSALPAVKNDNLYFIPPEILQRHTPRILDGATRLCEQLEQARGRAPR